MTDERANAMDLGAEGNGLSNDTTAVQSAIDGCYDAGGGTVYFPPGRYLSGSIVLKSRVSLNLEGGAVLLASRDPSDYADRRILISAEGAENVTICGRGTIDGQADEDLGRRPGHEGEERPKFRTSLVRFDECTDVSVRDVTMKSSDAWTLHFRGCCNVLVDGITILNNYFRTNTDGINPVSCRNVHISNCYLVCGDDCVCIKSHDGISCENVVVSNCTMESIATAIKIGTESSGDFRHILVNNCVVRNSTVGLGIYVKDGGTVEGVTCTNLSIETLVDSSSVNAPRLGNATYPIFIDVEKRTDSSPIGKVRDVIMRDILIYSDNGILIQGMEQSPVENLTLDNVLFRVTGGFPYDERVKHAGGRGNPDDDRITVYARKPSYATLANIDGLVVHNLRVSIPPDIFQGYPRSALYMVNARDCMLSGLRRFPGKGGGPPVIDLHECQHLLLSEIFPGETSIGVDGENTKDIRIPGEVNDSIFLGKKFRDSIIWY